ncbi:cytidylyltransferase domain-containing protein [Phenylobacterium terrae]|uniref:Cytidylyltransferase domain-containing protein n=1 Tax=Phenylobacterium terrae TaxID=2665495 RepID=A0ABW4MZ15_9CAUL
MMLAILQVRMTTLRLPGKAMAPLRGEPMVWRQLERIRQARSIDRVVVATSDEPADDVLASFLVSRGQAVHRGSAANLTDRFMSCVDAASPVTGVLRLKGDSPFVDPGIIDAAVRKARASGAAYTSNRVQRTFPKGLEVEVAAAAALWDSARLVDPATAAAVSPMAQLRARPDRYGHAHLHAARDLSALDWRIKTRADLAFAEAVYGALHAADPAFTMADVLDLLQGRQDIARWAA